MLIIDRFILKIFIQLFFIILGGILVAIFVFDSLDSLVNNPNLKDVLKSALQLLPPAIELIAPYAGLLATILTFGALYKHSEIICMKSAGLSQLQIIRSIIILSFFMAAFLYINQSYFVRLLNAESKSISLSSRGDASNWYKIGGKLINLIKPELFFNRVSNLNVISFDFNNLNFSLEKYSGVSKDRQGNWLASDLNADSFKQNTTSSTSQKNVALQNINLQELINAPAYPSIYQSAYDLYTSWQESNRGEYVSRLSLLLLFKKFNYLLGFILLILLAVVFSESQPRSNNNLAKVILVTLIFYFYWFSDQLLFILAKEGTVDVFSGSFGASIILILSLIYFFKFKKI